nr:alpha/beta hydrolase [Streptomyces sp. SID3343]
MAVDPGGPGSGVQSMTRMFAVTQVAVGTRYDVVGIDPRGTAGSTAVDCVDDAGIDRLRSLDPTPDDAAELERIGAFYREFADGCTTRSAKLLPHLGTQDVVSDLDVLRGVLGEDKLNYFGWSYGTYIGALYLEKFPTHTGRVVLDAPMDPAMDRISGAKDQAAGFEQAYRAFVTDCLKQADCPFKGSVDDAIKRTADRLHELGTTPFEGKGGRTVGEGEVSYAISTATYNEETWRDLRVTMRIYLGKDANRAIAETDFWLGRAEDGSYPWDHTDANMTINCADGRMLTVAEADKLAKEAQSTMPVAGPGVIWSFAADCRPNGPDRARPISAPGAPPVLVVGSTGDPATPYGQAQALTSQLPGAVLLTREKTGHAAYAKGNACIDAAVEKYLFTGELPAVGARCAK